MPAVSFDTRSFQVVDGPLGARDVVLGTIVTTADARVLADALSWRRNRDFAAAPMEDADAIQAMRAMVELLDHVETLSSGDHAGPMTLTQPQVVLLAETAAAYVHARGDEEFIAPPERDRLARLRALSQPLFDLVAGFSAAMEQLRAQTRSPRS